MTDSLGVSEPIVSVFSKFVVIGDVGGHADALSAILLSYGCDPATGYVPAGTVVVQVGDLIRLSHLRGHDSDGCVAIADRAMRRNPDRWIQLFGNHEIGAIGGPRHPTWSFDGVSLRTIETLCRWWERREAFLAVALRDVDGRDTLVTHAGLVFLTWDDLGRPRCAETSAALNAPVGFDDVANPRTTPSVGHIVTPGITEGMWPSCLSELYPSWHAVQYAPFDQVHGHSSPADWRTGRLRSGYGAFRRPYEIDVEGRIVRTCVGSTKFTAIDWVLFDRSYVGRAFETTACELRSRESIKVV